MQARIQNASVWLFLLTAGIAATGYVRELALASLFGIGADMDAFYFSLGLIYAVYELVFAGALGATIVPLLHVHDVDSNARLDEQARFVVTAALVVATFAGVLSTVLWIEMPHIIDAMAPRMDAQARATSTEFAMIFVWSLPASALTALFALVLNARHRFALAALVYLANNVVFIVLLLLLAPSLRGRALPVAALVAPNLTVLVLGLQLARLGLLRRVRPDLSREFFRPIWHRSRWLLISFGVGSTGGLLMTSHFIVRSFAAGQGEGAIAALGYAFRLYEVPLSLLANPAATIGLPVVATLYAAGRFGDIARVCRRISLWGLIVLFPAAIVTWGGADIIVHVLLQRGNFDAEAARLTAEALRGFAPAVMMEAVFVVFFRVFYALHRPDRTVIVALVTLSSLIVFLWLAPKSALIALPLCLSAAFTVAACLLAAFLVPILGWEAFPSREQAIGWLASAALAVAAWRFMSWWRPADMSAQLAALSLFLGIYAFSLGVLLPECRREAFGMIRWAWAERDGGGSDQGRA